MAERRPTAPVGLAPRGRRFWSRTVATYSLSPSELELLTEVCRALDECEALQVAVAAEGVSVAGSKGQPRPHPALAELRQARLATARLLAHLALPDDDGASVPSPASMRGRKAAQSRWALQGRRDRGTSPA